MKVRILRVYENEMLRIFRPKRDEVTGGWRKLHNEEFHNVYCSPNIIRIINSRTVRLAGYVARMGKRGMHIVDPKAIVRLEGIVKR
jgi:hypothetical protein